MLIRGLVDEDFVNYKLPSMFISTAFCTFKCEEESGVKCCQNSDLMKTNIIDFDLDELVERYVTNPITDAVCFGGLEPLEQYDDIADFISRLRKRQCFDPVVIYTGYYKNEILPQVESLGRYSNIVIKYGRYIPNQKSHYDEVLGVSLASPNQYAEELN